MIIDSTINGFFFEQVLDSFMVFELTHTHTHI